MREAAVTLGAVTPLAVGGPRGAAAAEGFRVPSIRGGLHWWFRAAWGGTEAPAELLEAERAVFGGGTAGSTVDLWVSAGALTERSVYVRMNDPKPVELSSGRTAVPTRRAHDAGGQATLHMRFRPHVPPAAREQFLGSLKLLCLLGGIGGRWRRGFGSVWPVGADASWAAPIGGEDLPQRAQWLEQHVHAAVAAVRPARAGTPRPSQASGIRVLRADSARLFLVEPRNGSWKSWEEAMDALRDDFYRRLKGEFTKWFGLKIESIGRIKPERQPSPIIIQIKPTKWGGLVGVVLVLFSEAIEAGMGSRWAAWDQANISALNLAVQKVALP